MTTKEKIADMIHCYELKEQKIVDGMEERDKHGHGPWDKHELSNVREFLCVLRYLEKEG